MKQLPKRDLKEKKGDRNAWILAILSIVYTLSPIDIIGALIVKWIGEYV